MGVSVTAEGISNILGIKSRSARYSQYLHNIYTLQACFFSFFSPLSIKFFQLVKIRLICFFALHRLYFFIKIETLKLHIAVFSRPLLHNIYSFTVVRLLLLCFKALFGDSSSLRPSRPVCLCAQEAPRWASSPGDFPPTILLHLRSQLLLHRLLPNLLHLCPHLEIISIAPKWTFAMNQKIRGLGTGDGNKTDDFSGKF